MSELNFPNSLIESEKYYSSEKLLYNREASLVLRDVLEGWEGGRGGRHKREIKDFSGGGKEPACQCRRKEVWVQFLGWEDSLENEMAILHYSCLENNGLQYSCLGNPMVRGAWWATVHRVAKS